MLSKEDLILDSKAYETLWGCEEDKEIFYKLMEKWDDFFSIIDISESMDIKKTDETVVFVQTSKDAMPVYVCNKGSEYEFYYAYKRMDEKGVSELIMKADCLYYKFMRKDVSCSMHFYLLSNGYPNKLRIKLNSSILEKSVYVDFFSCRNRAFNIGTMMNTIGLKELGSKIASITSELKEITEQKMEQEGKKRRNDLLSKIDGI